MDPSEIAKAAIVAIGAVGFIAVVFFVAIYLADDKADRLIRKLDDN